MPEVEKSTDWSPDDNEVTVKIFSVQVNILSSPTFNIKIKSTYNENKGIIVADIMEITAWA